MGLSTHILDLVTGMPAQNVTVEAFFEGNLLVRQETNSDGRCANLLGENPLRAGAYCLTFAVKPYFESLATSDGENAFYKNISIDFIVSDTERHYHVPLLLSPYGYSTYRGS